MKKFLKPVVMSSVGITLLTLLSTGFAAVDLALLKVVPASKQQQADTSVPKSIQVNGKSIPLNPLPLSAGTVVDLANSQAAFAPNDICVRAADLAAISAMLRMNSGGFFPRISYFPTAGGDATAVFDGDFLGFNQGARLINRQEAERFSLDRAIQGNFDIKKLDGHRILPNYNSWSREPFYQIIPQQCNNNARVETVPLGEDLIPVAPLNYINTYNPNMVKVSRGLAAVLQHVEKQANLPRRVGYFYNKDQGEFFTDFAAKPLIFPAVQFVGFWQLSDIPFFEEFVKNYQLRELQSGKEFMSFEAVHRLLQQRRQSMLQIQKIEKQWPQQSQAMLQNEANIKD